MMDYRNRRREEAASIGSHRGSHRLAPIPGLVLDGPFAETKEFAYVTPAPNCVTRACPLDQRGAQPVGSARRGAS